MNDPEQDDEQRDSPVDFRQLVELSPEGVLVHDGGRVCYANAAMASLLGLPSAAAVIGLPVERFLAETAIDGDSTMVRKSTNVRAPIARADDSSFMAEIISNRLTVGAEQFVQVIVRDVSGRLAAEERIRRSEERFRAVALATKDAVWELDLATGQIDFCEPVQQLFRYPAELQSVTLDWWLEKIHPEDRRRVEEKIFATLASDSTEWADEFRFRRGDDSFAYVVDRAVIFRDSHGTAVRAIGALRDVTAKRLAEAEREESELRFRSLVEQSVVGVYMVQDYRVAYANPKACEILGRTAEELQQTNLLDLVHPDDRELVIRNVRLRIEGHIDQLGYTARALRKDGDVIVLQIHGRAVNLNGARGLMGVVQDITAQTVANEEREAMLEMLAAERARLDSFIQTLPGMVWEIWTDPEAARTREKFVSSAVEKLYGYSVAEWLAMSDTSLEIIHPDDRPAVDAKVAAALTDGSAAATFRAIRKDGRVIHVLSRAQAVYDVAGKPIGLRGMTLDITAQRALEQQLEQTSRMASLGQLAATIAHEINNVLMGIQPAADLLRRRSDADDQLLRAADLLGSAVQRGRNITQEILRYTRDVEPALAAVPVGAWLQNVVSDLRSLASPAVDVHLREIDEKVVMHADAALLQQALLNLVANGRDAMPEGGRIDIAAFVEEPNARFGYGELDDPHRYVHITIADNGAGMSREVLAHLFEPMFTTKRNSGTGLGLAVVRRVVERHGGRVFVESQPALGTTFHLFVPRAEPLLSPSASDVSTASTRASRVLLVEDDVTVASGLQALLELEDLTTDVCPRGADAVDKIGSFRPDVVVLDIGLPDIDGVEVYRQIEKRWPSLPVIFSTGHGDESELDAYLSRPNVAYLLKPYDIETLLRTIEQVCRKAN